MASATNNEEKSMATEVVSPGADEPDDRQPERPDKSERGSFFSVHKKGQGYWTRICTAGAAALIILLTAKFIWTDLRPQINEFFAPPPDAPAADFNAAQTRGGYVTGVLTLVWLVGGGVLAWWLMNKPANVEFLIATDSEMKKVNWTSRAELIGSTKVVIIFMLLIAALLFVLDMYFTRVFYLLNVLVADSPLWDYVTRNFGTTGAVLLDMTMGTLIFGGAAWAVWGALRSR